MNTESDYFVLMGEKTAGPLSAAQLRAMFAAGHVSAATLFATDGSKDWKPLRQLPGGLSERLPDGSLSYDLPFQFGDLVLAVLCLGGVAVVVYFGFAFDTTRGEVQNVGLLNDRLCGVVGGSALATLAVLIKICWLLKEILKAK